MQAKGLDADRLTVETACAAVRQLDLAVTAERLAAGQRDKVVASALKKMNRILGAELSRLEDLAVRWGHVSLEEIAALRDERTALESAIRSARLRVEAVRVAVSRS